MVSVTIYEFLGLIYSSPTETFLAQARPKQALHVTSILLYRLKVPEDCGEDTDSNSDLYIDHA